MIPYIGITDFMTSQQVERLLKVFSANLRPNQNRRLHVGVMMSYKTLNGFPTKWTNSFPAKENIADIFYSDETMNCLHYADYEGIDVESNLRKVLVYGGSGMNALQLDMIWPDPWTLARVLLGSGRQYEVILQINEPAIAQVGGTPAGVVEKLRDYHGMVKYVLLDKSMGKGLDMDARYLYDYAIAIRRSYPDIHIAAAGGLGPDSLQLLGSLPREFPDLSIDAQSRLRPSGSALDPVDWGMAETYLMHALNLLR